MAIKQTSSAPMNRTKSQIRAHFRRVCYERDGYACVTCGCPKENIERLDVHHITDRNEMPGGGYVLENGISLCPDCHLKAEKYHQTDGWDWEEGYHPNSLYFRIGSSKEEAIQASKNELI